MTRITLRNPRIPELEAVELKVLADTGAVQLKSPPVPRFKPMRHNRTDELRIETLRDCYNQRNLVREEVLLCTRING